MFQREREMRPLVAEWLERRALIPFFEVHIWHNCDIVAARFEHRLGRRIPPIADCVAVELKLTDIAGVLYQAKSNLSKCNESWAAMPLELIRGMQWQTLDKFMQAGIGLLAVSDKVGVAIHAVRKSECCERLAKKLWRRNRTEQASIA